MNATTAKSRRWRQVVACVAVLGFCLKLSVPAAASVPFAENRADPATADILAALAVICSPGAGGGDGPLPGRPHGAECAHCVTCGKRQWLKGKGTGDEDMANDDTATGHDTDMTDKT